MRTTTVSAALVAAFCAIATAHAQDRVDLKPTLDVPYGDLNLNSPLGAHKMLWRIKQAATFVCGGQPDIRELTERTRFRVCVREATDGAVAQLNAPLVTALHTGRPIEDARFAQDGAPRH